MGEFRMPSLGADMDSGTVVEWCVHPGDRVHRGDIVAAVDTDKAVIDVECFETGVVDRLLVDVGTKVPVGTPIAEIVPDGMAAAGPSGPPGGGAAPEEDSPPATGPGGTPRATPLVRRLAERAGVDLGRVPGTGPGGTITRADVDTVARRSRETDGAAGEAPGGRPAVSPYARRLAAERGLDPAILVAGPDGVVHAADVPTPAGPASRTGAVGAAGSPVDDAGEPVPASGAGKSSADRVATGSDRMRAAIAARMTRSAREIPQYHVDATIELGLALERIRRANRDATVSERIVPAALLLRAAAHAARAVPELNGHWIDGSAVAGGSVDLGIVVSLRGGGLLVPTVPSADRLSPAEMMQALRDVVSRARTGRLRSSDTVPATITVSDMGETGADAVHGVIFPPQVALIGFGAVTRRPWADGDLLGIRPQVVATVTGDHRATDGAAAGRFLHALDEFLHDVKELP